MRGLTHGKDQRVGESHVCGMGSRDRVKVRTVTIGEDDVPARSLGVFIGNDEGNIIHSRQIFPPLVAAGFYDQPHLRVE